MKNKYYFAIPFGEFGSVKNLFKEIQSNLGTFFNLQPLDVQKDFNITLISPFEAEERLVDTMIDFMAKNLKGKGSKKLYFDDFIEFRSQGQSFGWKFEASEAVQRVINVLHEVLRGQQIFLTKTPEEIFETLHASLIKECKDADVFARAAAYIKVHYPEFGHPLAVQKVFLYKKSEGDDTWQKAHEFSTEKS